MGTPPQELIKFHDPEPIILLPVGHLVPHSHLTHAEAEPDLFIAQLYRPPQGFNAVFEAHILILVEDHIVNFLNMLLVCSEDFVSPAFPQELVPEFLPRLGRKSRQDVL